MTAETERATMIADAARWAAERLLVYPESSAVVDITPGDATLYRFAVLRPQPRWAPDGESFLREYLVTVVGPGRGSAYPWNPGGWMEPGYVAEKWQCDPHTADVLAEFLTRLAELMGFQR